MSKPFTFDIKGFNKLGLKIKQLPARLQKEIDAEIGFSAESISGKQLRMVPVDQGRIKQGLNVKKVKDLEWELNSNANYSAFIEFGTKKKTVVPAGLEDYAAQFKGLNPSGGSLDDFFLAILNWVKRKGISGRFSTKSRRRLGNKAVQLREDFETAYPIFLSILHNGINPQPFFFPPYLNEKRNLLKNIDNILKDL